jgi:hypothetical protein
MGTIEEIPSVASFDLANHQRAKLETTSSPFFPI